MTCEQTIGGMSQKMKRMNSLADLKNKEEKASPAVNLYDSDEESERSSDHRALDIDSSDAE